MNTENLSTLKIHKLTQAQYDRELAAGNIKENELYLTPDEEIDLNGYATIEQLDEKADASHKHEIADINELQTSLDTLSEHSHSSFDVTDIRNIEGLPSQFEKKKVSAFFTNKNRPSGSDAWVSGIHVKGWTDTYKSWELAASCDQNAQAKPLSYRMGMGSTWSEWRTLIDSSSIGSQSVASATKATQDANGNVITSTYETKSDANTKLNEAKSYTDTKTSSLATSNSVATQIGNHNTSDSAHNDIRLLIEDLTIKLNNFLDVDDATTDQLSEVLTLIENNKDTLDSLTTNKINVSDIIDNLTTSSTSKVLSAKQGVAIKGLIDALQDELDSHTHAISDVADLQNTLDGKANATHTHTVANISDLTATATELNYMDGVTSNVQTQLNKKAETSHSHSTIDVVDIRETEGLPSQYATKKVSAFFAEHTTKPLGVTKYASGIHVKGWGNGYKCWELATSCDQNTNTLTPLSFRMGVNDTWGDWRVIIDSSNISSQSVACAMCDASGNIIASTYETKTDASDKLTEAKTYAKDYVDGIKSDLEEVVGKKADASHTHAASDITSGTFDNNRLPTVPVTKGGTGRTTLTSGSYLVGNGTGIVTLKTSSEVMTDLGAMSSTDPTGTGTVSFNRMPSSDVGIASVALGGSQVTASGLCSYADGCSTIASGNYSHASGYGTLADGDYAYATGSATVASGSYSHTEGLGTKAIGICSHAEGAGTKASGDYSHVQGRYNVEDKSDIYAHIVGNGDASAPSNAHTLDWDGNAWFAGDVYVGGSSQDDGKVLATKEYVDSLFASVAEIKNYLGI